jgi:AcrR family transcriptional regulator
MSRLPAAARRAQLLDSAATVFAVRGFAGTTTAELAKAAGVSEPIIYRHFKSKKELFIELVRMTGQETIHAWEQSLKDLTDPAERLVRLIGSNPMVTQRGQTRYRVIVQAMTETEDADIQLALRDHIAGLHASLSREVKNAQDAGVVSRRFSPELTSWALIYIGLGYGTLSAMHMPSHGLDKQGNHIDDVLGQLILGDNYKRAVEAAKNAAMGKADSGA